MKTNLALFAKKRVIESFPAQTERFGIIQNGVNRKRVAAYMQMRYTKEVPVLNSHNVASKFEGFANGYSFLLGPDILFFAFFN